jgi:uncharacterized protein with NRDE domain
MCTAFIAWKVAPSYPLIVLSNRDEFHQRPTAAAAWDEHQVVIGGVDLEAGGRWLGVNRRNFFAVLLNVRDLDAIKPEAASRGALVDDFLNGALSAYQYALQLHTSADKFNPYNLILSDGEDLVFYSNQGAKVPQKLAPGLYGVSNGGLDEPWPKVAAGKQGAAALLDNWSVEGGFTLLADKTQAADEELPRTGVPLEFERLLSSLFITSEQYGTRASTIVTFSDGQNNFYERSFDSAGKQSDEKHYSF